MKKDDVTRRDFHRLTLAAFGGALAGSLMGVRPLAADEKAKEMKEESRMLKDPHVCCGLNTCKGHGKGGANECAGMGACATAEAHGCHGANACHGQSGCGEKVGANACKGQGVCAVPLSGDSWKDARAKFEAAMKAADRKFGAAPAACGA